jgi:hypothetical protein
VTISPTQDVRGTWRSRSAGVESVADLDEPTQDRVAAALLVVLALGLRRQSST